MDFGYIKAYRTLERDKVVGMQTGYFGPFVALLMRASGSDGYQGLQRGQVRISRRTLAKDWGVTERFVRTFLSRLIANDMLIVSTQNATQNGVKNDPINAPKRGREATVYTIVNYAKYQDPSENPTHTSTREVTQNGVKTDPPKRNGKKDKNIEPSVLCDQQLDIEDSIAEKTGTVAQATKDTEVPKTLLDRWNSVVGFQKAPHLTPARRSAIKARIRDAGGVEGVIDLIDHLAKQDWATGRKKNPKTGKPYNARFDTFFKPEHFIRHLETAQAEKAKVEAYRKSTTIREEDLGT